MIEPPLDAWESKESLVERFASLLVSQAEERISAGIDRERVLSELRWTVNLNNQQDMEARIRRRGQMSRWEIHVQNSCRDARARALAHLESFPQLYLFI